MKLPEELDKSSFRQWDDAVDMQLEMVHDFKNASFVLSQVRRSKVVIHKPVLETLLSIASVDFRQSQVEMGIDPESALTREFDDPFHQRTTFLNAYLIGRLNTSLHDKAVGVEHRNGFEMCRQICQMIEAVLENRAPHDE